MRTMILFLSAFALLGCDDAGTGAPVDGSTPDQAPTDASADLALPDLALDAALADAAVDAAPDVAVDAASDQAVDPCGAADPEAPLALVIGTAFAGEICRDRSAWFALEAPAGLEVSVALSFQHRLGDLELSVYADESPRRQVAESATAADVERVALEPGADTRRYLIEVYGYRRAVGRYTLLAQSFDPAEGLPTAVSGSVRYEDKAFDANGFTGERPILPARGVRVEAVRAVDGAVVASGRTDDAGAFALSFSGQPGEHYVRAVSAGGVGEQAVEVRDVDANLRYAVQGAPFASGSAPPPFELIASADDAIGGALNIVDTANQAFAFYAPFVDGPAPTLTYRWQPGVAHGCGSCYANDSVRLAGGFEDTDEYDDVIILHELWHWFMEHYSADDSPGGTHRDRLVSPALAFGEGVAYAFAGLIRGSPEVVDTFIDSTRHIDMEAMTVGGEDLDVLYGTTDGTPGGAHREELVEGILWDSIDAASPDEPFDQVAIGLDGAFELLRRLGIRRFIDVGARGIDVADWLNMLQCDDQPAAALAEERRYPFAADDAVCEKGRVPAPIELSVQDGRVWLSSKSLDSLMIRRGEPGAWKARALTCAVRCDLGPAEADVAVVVSGPGQAWAGASWIGAAFRARLAGPIRHEARAFAPLIR